jgi:hypothetical protein
VHPTAELQPPQPLNVLNQDDRVLTRQLASRMSPFYRCPSLHICDMIPIICAFVCRYCPAFLYGTFVTIHSDMFPGGCRSDMTTCQFPPLHPSYISCSVFVIINKSVNSIPFLL